MSSAEQLGPIVLGPDEISHLDGTYQPLPAFEHWAKCKVDDPRWERYRAELEVLKRSTPPEVLERALKLVRRAAAIDTGAIEQLYEVDRGFTITVASEAASWEAAIAQKGEEARSLIVAQLSAYEYLIDLATGAGMPTERSIRELHEVICAAQSTYRVITPNGRAERPFQKGTYKTTPNHVRTRHGDYKPHAPVDMTPPEMERLTGELNSDSFRTAHPVLQAAYAHYGLVHVHPFTDGNGRVARALASVFTYRGASVPVLVLSEDRDAYIDALEQADNGDIQTFVDFMLARTLDAIQLVRDSLGAARVPSVEQSVSDLEALRYTRGGYRHIDVDNAGVALVTAFYEAIRGQLERFSGPDAAPVRVIYGNTNFVGQAPDGYRMAESGSGRMVTVRGQELAHEFSISVAFRVAVPEDSGVNDDVLIYEAPRVSDLGGVAFAARVSELLPTLRESTTMRIQVAAEGAVARLLQRLVGLATTQQ